mmetsp:Transcript_42935/g.110668  ORF Transcript_42935/g.110668 Transcript_42935/m.110668 type:complete len:347 (-) Transcript_42935:233-1273(-)
MSSLCGFTPLASDVHERPDALAMAEAFKTYMVQNLAFEKKVQVRGESLGDLRAAIRQEFGIPSFEQNILFSAADGQFVEVQGDDTVPMAKKAGLLEATQLMIERRVDPRYKMEKETAFKEALVARRFAEAKDILASSGITIDVNCIHMYLPPGGNQSVTESPYKCAHPALTVAIQAGLEDAVRANRTDPVKIRIFMSQENEVGEVIQLLIEKQADVNATGEEVQDAGSAGAPDVHGKSPLAAAVQRGSPMLVKMLLDAKADPNHEMKYDILYQKEDGPFGRGVLRPESWLDKVCNGSVHPRDATDPRNENKEAILALLTAARTASPSPVAERRVPVHVDWPKTFCR